MYKEGETWKNNAAVKATSQPDGGSSPLPLKDEHPSSSMDDRHVRPAARGTPGARPSRPFALIKTIPHSHPLQAAVLGALPGQGWQHPAPKQAQRLQSPTGYARI